MRCAIICVALVLLAAKPVPSTNPLFGFEATSKDQAHFTGFNQAPFNTGHSDVRSKQR